jgi:hypothetical protein
MLARSGSYQAKQMERVGMIRLDGENLPIDLFGRLQSAGLLMLDRNQKSIRNFCHKTLSKDLLPFPLARL